MTSRLTVSVVIVSRGRPDALRRCLLGVSQMSYPTYEVVVVADAAGCSAVAAMPQAAQIKLIEFDRANISEARNIGITVAAGEVVAFIDDDSVPEPSWLDHLAAPFADLAVMAAGGYVRGRNGISFQNKANVVDRTGKATALGLRQDHPVVLSPTPDRAIKTEGTNMAVRRECLAQMGGFDPAYRFFLDETDLNLRLADLGLATAIVPLAQVHHGFAASAGRRADRVPTDLFEIGASWAVFLGKYCHVSQREAVWQGIQTEQRRRVLRHMVAGGLEPRDVSRLLRQMGLGYHEGLKRGASQMPPLGPPSERFRRFSGRTGAKSILLSGRSWSRKRLRRKSALAVAAGKTVTLLLFSPTAFYHRVAFRPEGYWEQTGGLFGKSDRSQTLFTFWSFRSRVAAEAARLQVVRSIG